MSLGANDLVAIKKSLAEITALLNQILAEIRSPRRAPAQPVPPYHPPWVQNPPIKWEDGRPRGPYQTKSGEVPDGA